MYQLGVPGHDHGIRGKQEIVAQYKAHETG